MKILNLPTRVAASNRRVPYTPSAVSHAMVLTQALAKRLAATATANLSRAQFDRVALKRGELLIKSQECAQASETLLRESTNNVAIMFNLLVSYLMLEGTVLEEKSTLEDNPQDAYLRGKVVNHEGMLRSDLIKLHMLAVGVGLCQADYCVDGAIQPDLLWDACMARIAILQQRLENNDRDVLSLSVQVQKDIVLGAVASSLMRVCEWGLDNQITLESTPQVQEDVLVAMATCVDFPFSGAWPAVVEVVRKSELSGSASTLVNGGAQ